MTSVSIVILNYNGQHFLEKFLPTIIEHSKGHQIVIADNNSSDGSIDFIMNSYPEILLISFTKNYGFCGGYNRALKQLNTDIFVIINSDIEVTKNWITPVLQLFDKDDKIAAVQPKLLDFNFRNKFEYAGGAGGFIDKYGYPFCRGRIFDTIETDIGQYNEDREIFWASGACLFIRKDLFDFYGGFDDDFFAHMEEIDLCWRMKLDGYKVYYCGNSVVYHVGGGTLAYANPQKTFLNFRNSLLVLIKNLPTQELIWKIPIRLVLDYIASFKYVLSGKIIDAFMIIKAHFYVLFNLSITINKRNFKSMSNKKLAGVYPKLLLSDYYIKKNRNFSDLDIH